MTSTLSPSGESPVPSERLLILLQHAKRPDTGNTWKDVATALADLYHPEMTLANVIFHLTEAFAEMVTEPRFAVGRGGMAATNLLLAPVVGHHAVHYPKHMSLDTSCTVEEFYDAIVAHFLGQFSIASIGWCRPWYDGSAKDQASSLHSSDV